MTRVLVIGGGPGGTSAAALLAKHGADVTLVERTRFPRHHVGESLQPASLQMLDAHFDLKSEFANAGFARKYGAVYVWGEQRDPWNVLFDARLDTDVTHLTEEQLLAGDFLHAWQVDRATFDHILMANARKWGVSVLEDTEAVSAAWSDKRIESVSIRSPDGQIQVLTPDWIIDATGQRCWIGRQLGAVRVVQDLCATASYGYFRNADGLPAPLGRHVQYVVTIPQGWVWFIPISSEWTSIGVVTQVRKTPSESEFLSMAQEALQPLQLGIWEHQHGAKLHHARDWSYINHASTGPNWLTVGDASAFVDPILSGGVDFAIRSGLNAAMAIATAESGDAGAIERFDFQHTAEIKAYLRMARYWYGNNRSVDGFFWQARSEIPDGSASTPLRAFVYLTSGQYAADTHFRVFNQAQEQKIFGALGVGRAALRARLPKKP